MSELEKVKRHLKGSLKLIKALVSAIEEPKGDPVDTVGLLNQAKFVLSEFEEKDIQENYSAKGVF